jgi:hypothetical protein
MLTGIRHRAEPSQTKGRLAFTSALSSRVLVETPKARAFSAKRFVRSISSAPVATAVVAGSGPAGMRQDGSSDFQLGEGADFLRRKRSLHCWIYFKYTGPILGPVLRRILPCRPFDATDPDLAALGEKAPYLLPDVATGTPLRPVT